MSFVSDFKKCFQQGLEPFGFRLMKGTDTFGKLVNNEILLYVFFDKRNAFQRGNKAFTIISGVQTIYSYELSQHQLQISGSELINYAQPGSDNVPDYIFEYNSGNVSEVLDKALKQTLSFAVPEMMKVTDLKSCVEYLGSHRSDMLYNADKCYRDSVLLIMTEDQSDFKDALKTAELSILRAFNNDSSNPYYQSSIRDLRSRLEEELINSRDRALNDSLLREAAMKEAQRRTNRFRFNGSTWEWFKDGVLQEAGTGDPS